MVAKSTMALIFLLLFVLKPLSFSSHFFGLIHMVAKKVECSSTTILFLNKNLLVGLLHSLIVMVYC